jgi:hypothetical protein
LKFSNNKTESHAEVLLCGIEIPILSRASITSSADLEPKFLISIGRSHYGIIFQKTLRLICSF